MEKETAKNAKDAKKKVLKDTPFSPLAAFVSLAVPYS
jgi:hypothetical protein